VRNDSIAHPLWELDPRHHAQPTYDDFERMFLAAYSAAFRLQATPDRIHPYLTRYLSFNVVAPWVRDFASHVHGDEAAELLVDAALDPMFDWRHIARWLEANLPLIHLSRDDGSSCHGRFQA